MKRTPLARRTSIKRKRAGNPRRVAATCSFQRCKRRPRALGLCLTHAKQEADRLFAIIIRSKNGGRCIRCGKLATDTSHVVSRRYLAVRFELDNAEPMCRGCHHWQHMNPLQAEAEWWLRLGHTYGWLRQHALSGENPDYVELLTDFRERVAR